jgi:hypothetical protein
MSGCSFPVAEQYREGAPENLEAPRQDSNERRACSPATGHGLLSKVRTFDRTLGRVGVVGGFGLGAPVALQPA